MNPPEQIPPPPKSSISAEALVGIGMTLTWLGLLGLLLGWAEVLRHEMAVAWIWLPFGAVVMVVGVITAMIGSGRKKSR